jgi:hypothetical protein
VRAYTENEATGAVLRIADRTFTLTVSGNDVPEFTTPVGSFDTSDTATFVAAINDTELVVSSVITGPIVNGMSLRGIGVIPGTTIVDTGTANGGIGTYTVNISQNNLGATITGWVGTYYDGDQLDIQIAIDNVGPTDPAVVSIIDGELPGGIKLSPTGLISGYIQPAVLVDEVAGYDLTPQDIYPYDFLVSAISKNYQFTLQVTDGVSTDLKTFSFFVYNRDTLNASTTQITADNSVVTADETTERRPFIVNALPSNLGTVRSDNYYAYQFIANDYDTPQLKFAVGVNEGIGLPPGLTLDPNSGWYYGYIPKRFWFKRSNISYC